MGLNVRTIETLAQRVAKFTKLEEKASVLFTKPQTFGAIKPAELKFAPLKTDVVELSKSKQYFNDSDFDWLYWKRFKGALPETSTPIDYSKEAKYLTEKFSKEEKIYKKIPDGFRITPSQFEEFTPNGKFTLDLDFPAAGEYLYIDKRTDKGLNTTIKKLKEQLQNNNNLSEFETADLLKQFVNKCYNNTRNHWTDSFPTDFIALGQTVKNGAGVCRHRSLLTKVLADEIGLDVALVRGTFDLGNNRLGNHMWNELTTKNGQKYLYDTILDNFINISSKSKELSKYCTTSNFAYKQMY